MNEPFPDSDVLVLGFDGSQVAVARYRQLGPHLHEVNPPRVLLDERHQPLAGVINRLRRHSAVASLLESRSARVEVVYIADTEVPALGEEPQPISRGQALLQEALQEEHQLWSQRVEHLLCLQLDDDRVGLALCHQEPDGSWQLRGEVTYSMEELGQAWSISHGVLSALQLNLPIPNDELPEVRRQIARQLDAYAHEAMRTPDMTLHLALPVLMLYGAGQVTFPIEAATLRQVTQQSIQALVTRLEPMLRSAVPRGERLFVRLSGERASWPSIREELPPALYLEPLDQSVSRAPAALGAVLRHSPARADRPDFTLALQLGDDHIPLVGPGHSFAGDHLSGALTHRLDMQRREGAMHAVLVYTDAQGNQHSRAYSFDPPPVSKEGGGLLRGLSGLAERLPGGRDAGARSLVLMLTYRYSRSTQQVTIEMRHQDGAHPFGELHWNIGAPQ